MCKQLEVFVEWIERQIMLEVVEWFPILLNLSLFFLKFILGIIILFKKSYDILYS